MEIEEKRRAIWRQVTAALPAEALVRADTQERALPRLRASRRERGSGLAIPRIAFAIVPPAPADVSSPWAR